MKIKIKASSFDEVSAMPPIPKIKSKKPNILFRTLVRILSGGELRSCNFKFDKSDIKRAGKGPYLILMNHSCFLDLKIAYKMFYPMPFMPVCTSDGLVGKSWLMRQLGCIPTKKFVTDFDLIISISNAIHKKKTSVLLYPEAGYSLDGRSTVLQKGMGKFFKKLKVPILMVETDGAFLHDPLYNKLKQRKVEVTAKAYCLLTKEEVQEKSVDEIDAIIQKAFAFDAFKSQKEKGVVIDTPDRAEGLESLLYHCPHCKKDGVMTSRGDKISCFFCGKTYLLKTDGSIEATDGDSAFTKITDWADYQRDLV
ncbi:MAG: hypothetical protein E7369_05555, partial [Clostridiales bacterium]|nr:hypothetical protein [Clostridiales bacterium]